MVRDTSRELIFLTNWSSIVPGAFKEARESTLGVGGTSRSEGLILNMLSSRLPETRLRFSEVSAFHLIKLLSSSCRLYSESVDREDAVDSSDVLLDLSVSEGLDFRCALAGSSSKSSDLRLEISEQLKLRCRTGFFPRFDLMMYWQASRLGDSKESPYASSSPMGSEADRLIAGGPNRPLEVCSSSLLLGQDSLSRLDMLGEN